MIHAPYAAGYLEGLTLFNAGHYFEAHEVLEDLWRITPGPEREFYQGLIQLAVILHHLGRKNFRGAANVLLTCRRHLLPFTPSCGGIDVGLLVAMLDRWDETIRQAQAGGPVQLGAIPHLWPTGEEAPSAP
jgi:predicted metal-dependent hydrolase